MTLIVYEDNSLELENAAISLKKALEGKTFAKICSAQNVSVSDILASDAYIFGVSDPDSSFWNEIKRLLAGINLAGRKAIFYSNNKNSGSTLANSLASSELSVIKSEQSTDVLTWINNIELF